MLRDTLKSIGKHSAVYAVGWMASSLVSLLMLPVYTRFLSTSDYGVLSLIDQSMTIVRILLMAGIGSAIAKFYHDASDNRQRRSVVATAFWMVLVSTGVWAGLCLWLAPWLSQIVLGSADYTSCFHVAVAVIACEGVLSVFLASLTAANRSRVFVVYSLVRLITGVTANVLFIVVLRYGVMGMLLGNLVSSGLASVAGVAQLVRENGLAFDTAKAWRMLLFGLPLIPASVAAAVMHNASQYLLRYFTDLHQVGIFALGFKLPFMLNALVLGTFAIVWNNATIYEVAKQPDAKRLFARITLYFMLVYAVCQFALAALAVPLTHLIAAPEYFQAYAVIPVVAFGCVFYAMHMFVSVGAYIREKTWLLPTVYVTCAVFNVAANWFVIPRFGFMGAAWVTVATYAMFSVLGYFVYRLVYSIPFPVVKLAALVLIFAVLGLSVTGLLPLGVWIQVPAGLVAIALMLAAGTFGLLTASERREAYDLALSLAESRLGIRFRRAATGGAGNRDATVDAGSPTGVVPLPPAGPLPIEQERPL